MAKPSQERSQPVLTRGAQLLFKGWRAPLQAVPLLWQRHLAFPWASGSLEATRVCPQTMAPAHPMSLVALTHRQLNIAAEGSCQGAGDDATISKSSRK